MTRLKDILNERGVTLKEFADTLNITYVGLHQQLKKPSYPTLEKWASALGVPMWQLFVDPNDLLRESKQNDIAAYVRYKGIHYTADTWDEFTRIVDEVRSIHD